MPEGNIRLISHKDEFVAQFIPPISADGDVFAAMAEGCGFGFKEYIFPRKEEKEDENVLQNNDTLIAGMRYIVLLPTNRSVSPEAIKTAFVELHHAVAERMGYVCMEEVVSYRKPKKQKATL